MIDTTNRYDLVVPPEPIMPPKKSEVTGMAENPSTAYVWSGTFPLPPIGHRVLINFNDLGYGIVRAYFVEHGWIGVHVTLEQPPAWHLKQTIGSKYAGQALVFGIEIKEVGP